MLYRILLVSAKYQCESAIGIHMSPPSWTSLPPPSLVHPSRLLQSPSLSSLRHAANSHWLSLLHLVTSVSTGFWRVSQVQVSGEEGGGPSGGHFLLEAEEVDTSKKVLSPSSPRFLPGEGPQGKGRLPSAWTRRCSPWVHMLRTPGELLLTDVSTFPPRDSELIGLRWDPDF